MVMEMEEKEGRTGRAKHKKWKRGRETDDEVREAGAVGNDDCPVSKWHVGPCAAHWPQIA